MGRRRWRKGGDWVTELQYGTMYFKRLIFLKKLLIIFFHFEYTQSMLLSSPSPLYYQEVSRFRISVAFIYKPERGSSAWSPKQVLGVNELTQDLQLFFVCARFPPSPQWNYHFYASNIHLQRHRIMLSTNVECAALFLFLRKATLTCD